MDFLTQQFIAFTRKARIEIVRLKDVLQKQTEAIEETATACSHKQKPSLEVRAELHIPEAIEHARTEQHNQDRRLQIAVIVISSITGVATIGAFAAAAYYAHYARLQYFEMKRAGDNADRTVAEVQKQTSLMQQEVEGAMAAIITKQFRITWPKQAYLSVILDNRGRVIGSNIHADFHLAEISLSDERATGKALPSWEFNIPEIGPSLDLPAERGIYLTISQQEFNLPKAIKLTGTFTYSNGFRKKLEPVCYYVLGAAHSNQQSMGPAVVACDGLPAQIAWYRQNQKGISAK